VPVRARAGRAGFEAMLFTHRGLSGPAMLQISSTWRAGDEIAVAFAPGCDWPALLCAAKRANPRHSARALLAGRLPARLAEYLTAADACLSGPLGPLRDARLEALGRRLADWRLRPTGTEGWRTAEVTVGGIDTAGLHSRSLEARRVPGLFVIGEAVDVTGWLGGCNVQRAWSSAAAAARARRGG
jgi:predicted Rossmann fold flavoprotein